MWVAGDTVVICDTDVIVIVIMMVMATLGQFKVISFTSVTRQTIRRVLRRQIEDGVGHAVNLSVNNLGTERGASLTDKKAGKLLAVSSAFVLLLVFNKCY